METCIQIPTLWKYYYKQVCGDYYRSEEKIIESIYVRAKLYKPGVLKKDYKSYISYRQKYIVSRQVNIQVLNTLFRVYLLPFYFVLLQFKYIKKSLSDLKFFFLNSNRLQELTEFEKEIYHNQEQLIKLLNRTDNITYNDIKCLSDYIKAPLTHEESNNQTKNIVSAVKFYHDEIRSHFIGLNAKSVRFEYTLKCLCDYIKASLSHEESNNQTKNIVSAVKFYHDEIRSYFTGLNAKSVRFEYTFKGYLETLRDIENKILIKKEWNEENNNQKQFLNSIINFYSSETRNRLISLNSKSVRTEYVSKDILTILKNIEKVTSIKKDYNRDSKAILFFLWFTHWNMIDVQKASAEKSNINIISFLSGISQKQVRDKYREFKQQFIDGVPNLRQWNDFKSHQKTIIDLLNTQSEIERLKKWFEEMDIKVHQVQNDLPR